MDFMPYIPLLLFVWLPISLYYWGLYKSNYWRRCGFPSVYAMPLIGSVGRVLTFQKCVTEQFCDFYFDKSTKDQPFVGFHLLYKPVIVIKDPALLKRVLVKDFGAFPNR